MTAGVTIVKYAADDIWEHHWEEDPKKTGVHISHSAAGTYSGKINDIKHSYESEKEAEEDFKKICKSNPSGNYAICPVLGE